jgi:hypothetical protein
LAYARKKSAEGFVMQTVIIRSDRFNRTYRDNNGDEPASRIPILTPREARQGVISGRVLLVLTVSLMLAVAAGVILAAVHMFPV